MQKVAVTLDGAAVRGSPFAVYVRAAPLHAPACLLLGLDDHRAASAGGAGGVGRRVLSFFAEWQKAAAPAARQTYELWAVMVRLMLRRLP